MKATNLSAAEGAALTAIATTGTAYLYSSNHPIFYFITIFAVAFSGFLGYKSYKTSTAAIA